MMTQRLSEPLPGSEGPSPYPRQSNAGSELSSTAPLAPMASVADEGADDRAPALASLSSQLSALSVQPQATSLDGLAKRVPGAQLPDLGTPQNDALPSRPADDVRSTLTSLQRGLDLGRSHNRES
jgi:hypothetical protein